jgi:hypothetical protein
MSMQPDEENASHTLPRAIERRTKRGLESRFWFCVSVRRLTWKLTA